MCDLWWHACPECGEEIKCYLPNHECSEFNGLVGQHCGKCEEYYQEIAKDQTRREQQAQQDYEWDLAQLEDKYGPEY
jgi:hypothetical protein